MVAAGGLDFIAASKEEYFGAFDKDAREELWKYNLPLGRNAGPLVYSVAGRKHVVIAAGGG